MIQLNAASPVKHYTKAAVVLVIALLALVLTACSGGGQETETTFTKSEGGVDMTLVYYATGDIVTKQTTHNVISYEAVGIEDAEEAKVIFDPIMAEFQGITGVTHSIEYGPTSATEYMEIDYNVADIAEVASLTGSSFEGNVESGAKLSLEQSRQVLLAGGFTEVK